MLQNRLAGGIKVTEMFIQKDEFLSEPTADSYSRNPFEAELFILIAYQKACI